MSFWSGVSGEEARQVAIRNAQRARSEGETSSSGLFGCLTWCAAMAAVAAVAARRVR